MTESNSWHNEVPSDSVFKAERKLGIQALGLSSNLRSEALGLLTRVSEQGFGHKNSWMGVPIIRLPEDLILQQEIIWNERPDLVVESGVARGGGLIFNASMQEMCGVTPRVLGLDNKIFDHTSSALNESRYARQITVLEGDSVSEQAKEMVASFAKTSQKTLLVLDSDHSSEHVLKELQTFVPLLPIGSIILVCDTLIDELPAGTYENRSWSNGLGPLHAIKSFLRENQTVEPYMREETRALMFSEIRDGVLRKVSL